MIRKKFTFTGSVQGVGFRYRAKYAAMELGITGWVSNEWDGSVHMEAQGSEQMINEMLRQINRGSYISIDWINSEEIPVVEKEKGFRVR